MQPRHLDSLSHGSSGGDVLCFTRRLSHNLLLERLPTHQAIAEEEQDAHGALPHVNVAGEVAVAVAHQPCIPHPPLVAHIVLQRPGDVAEDLLHHLEMFFSGSFKKPAHIPDGICQVWPSVDKIP
jgi:hypothetical protein